MKIELTMKQETMPITDKKCLDMGLTHINTYKPTITITEIKDGLALLDYIRQYKESE